MKIKDKWSLSIGFYPGILLGARSYDEGNKTTHVLYLPFIDIALEIYYDGQKSKLIYIQTKGQKKKTRSTQ